MDRNTLEADALRLGCYEADQLPSLSDQQLADGIAAETAATEFLRRLEQLPSEHQRRRVIRQLGMDLLDGTEQQQ